MADGFVKNYKLLEEKSEMEDLLGVNDICNKFANKIDSILEPSIVALVGPFGVGKSTMLHNLKEMRSKENELWVEFDAWKYPDRKDLWEGFVLDFAKQINPDVFNEAYKDIDGKGKGLFKGLYLLMCRGINLKFPGAGFIIEKFTFFFNSSPARRVFELQDILETIINKQEKNIFIIIEDIDRSGDAGVFFLETLKQFLRTAGISKKIVIIVPMANENYYKKIDSYLKCVDYIEFFEQKKISLEKFVNDVFDDRLFEEKNSIKGGSQSIDLGKIKKKQIISFLEGLFYWMPNVNMRLLKLIIRKADINYKNQIDDGHDPDFRVTLCFEAAKYFRHPSGSDRSFFDYYKDKKMLTKDSIFGAFINTVCENRESIYLDSEETKLFMPSESITLIDRVNDDKSSYPSFPWKFPSIAGEKERYSLTNFYCWY